MGIFEKSIPKYVVNPIDRQVEVAPQDVYVDDIFDPIFNANVRNAMRQKYGEGLYRVAGGYEEMLKNAWTGGEGILGKGMGVLSTFGRSMEKADDIVLGLLTEGVEGLSGQGFDNPLKQIFVEDEDYSGKRFLASTANIFRNLAGTTITEDDLGTAWNLPGLGIDLVTDVGILGGSLARNLAPAAKDFTSKELFENLGKSGIKTTVGEVGQLMSNYDDLMTRVAIDATAPGLRPAFKALKNKIVQTFQVLSPEEYIDFIKTLETVEDDTIDPAVRKQAQQQLASDEIARQTVPLFSEADAKFASQNEYDIEDFTDSLSAEENAIDRTVAALKRDIDAEEFAKRTYAKEMAELEAKISKSRVNYGRKLSKNFEKAILEAEARGYKTNYDKLLEFRDSGSAQRTVDEILSKLRSLTDLSNPDHMDVEYVAPVRKIIEAAESGNNVPLLDAAHSGVWTPYDAANKYVQEHIYQHAPYLMKEYSPYRISPSLRSSVSASGAPGISYAISAFRNIIRKDVKTGKMIFNTPEEFSTFFNSSKMSKNLEEFIPARPLSAHEAAGLSAEDAAKKSAMYARANRRKFKNLVRDVYFPPKDISDYKYTEKLIDLEDFLARYASPDSLSSKYAHLEAATPRQLAKYAEHPEQLVPLEKFLENNRLLVLDERGDILDVDPAAYHILSHAYPDLLRKPGKYPIFYEPQSKDVMAKAEHILLAYQAELRNISDSIGKRKKRSKSFLNVLYNTVEDISMKYLQPLRDETPHSLKSISTPLSLDKPLKGSEGTTTFLDVVQDKNFEESALTKYRSKNRLDDDSSLAYSRAVRDWFNATVPPNADIRDVIAIAKPFADTLDIGYRTGVKVPVRPKIKKDVNTFYNEVVPLIEQLTSRSAWGNYYLSQVFSSKDDVLKISKKDATAADAILKLRNLVGAPLAKDAHPKSEVFRELYNEVVKKHSADSLKFEPKHGGRDVESLQSFFSKPKTPSEIFKELEPRFQKAHLEGLYSSQKVQNLDTLAARFYNNFFKALDDIGVTEDEITKIIQQARDKGTASLDVKQLRKYRAYVQETSKVLSQTPYRVYARNAAHWNSSTSWQGITDVLSSVYPMQYGLKGEPRMPKARQRVDELITRELEQSLDSTRKVPFEYSDSDVEFLEKYVISKLPENVKGYWNPSPSQGLLYFDIPSSDEAYTFQLGMDVDVRPERFQIERFLKDFKGDLKKLNDIRTLDYGTLYSSSGRAHLTDVAARLDLRMNLIPEKDANLVDVFENAFNKYKPSTPKNVSEATETVKFTIAAQPPETVAKQSTETISTASTTAEETVNKMAGEMNDFSNKGGSESAGKTIFGERKWRWFKIIKDALSVSEKNAWRGQRATLRTTRATELAERFRGIVSRITVNGKFKDFKRFYILRQKEAGDIVTGKDFWTTFRRTGILIAPYEAGSKQLLKAQAALTENANLINKAADANIVEVVTQDYGKGEQVVIMRFTGDKNTVKYVKKASKVLDNAKYSDVVFSPPTKLTGEERLFMDSADMRELSGLMDELQTVAGDQAKLLGFNFDNTTPYTHHAMHRDKGSAEWLNRNFYTKLSSEDYDDISKLISNFDEYRKTDRGAFGTMLQDRRFRGDYFLLDDETHSLFEYSPDKIFTSTLADGIFANLQYQDFTDLFINDNFKIKDFFKTPEDLKKVLYAKDSKGRLSGNFANSELVSFKLDENGKIAGLIKHDKTTDTGLAKALADENTILVPANAVSHMDNILRKDVRMNNKFWTFINKHFTIPFKFGLLSNPGFILGNISDATLKLATTMSEKYGTTLTRELSNVTECINASQVLKNNYYEAFDVWKKVSAEYDIKLSPEATVADIVAMSPKYKEQFLSWLNGDLKVPYTYQNEAGALITEYREVPCELANDVVDNASIWTMLQGVQMNSDKMREYAELADIAPDSEFDVATNVFDRVTQGSGKYDKKNWRTWGLFMNNPYMKTLTDASGAWEDTIRTASVLDDLRHGQYSKEEFAKFARGTTGAEDTIQKRVRLDEAKNTMYNAQFDYERQSDFISKIGKTVPFPIFFLKNFEYWMELFDKNPQFVDNAIDIQEGLWSGYNEKEDKFMTEAKGRGAVPIGGDALPKWFKGVYKPSPLQSMFGAFNLLNDPVNNLAYRVNPVVSGAKAAAAEMLPDSDLTTYLQDAENVKYRPYSTDMYERNVKQGDPNFNAINYTIHRMNPYERTVNTYLRIPEKVREGEFQMSDVLPSVFQPMF